MNSPAPTSAAAPSSAPDTPPSGWKPPPRSLWFTLGGLLVIVVGVAAVLAAWGLPPFRTGVQRTENAYVRGQVTVISPQVSGYVTQVAVQDFQKVTAGQVLVRVDDRIYRQRVEQAEAALAAQHANLDNSAQSHRSGEANLAAVQAQLSSARAQLAREQANMRRINELLNQRYVSVRERDVQLAALRQAQAAVQQAQAQSEGARQTIRSVDVGREGLQAGVASAEAALRLARIDLSNTEIHAPAAGRLGEVGVRTGQYVTAGTQLMSLVPPTLWVTANFKEAQTERMRAGQPATLSVDALGGAKIHGHVERISPATGSEFSVIHPDNATGNFTKVAQRIPVRIAIDPDQPLAARLRAGMSVEAAVDTSAE